MKRIVVYLVVIIITVTVLLFLYNPELLEKVWLWIVGLLGSIVALLQQSWEWIKKKFGSFGVKAADKPNHDTTVTPAAHSALNHDQSGFSTYLNHKITLLRIQSEDDSTLGLLFYGETFCCHTIEDFCEDKPTHCRIPAGTYHLSFSARLSALSDYPEKIKNFQGHLYLSEVPAGLTGVIHYGGLGNDLTGDIILTDITKNQDINELSAQSKHLYENLYQMVSIRLAQGDQVIFEILNENWFKEKIN